MRFGLIVIPAEAGILKCTFRVESPSAITAAKGDKRPFVPPSEKRCPGSIFLQWIRNPDDGFRRGITCIGHKFHIGGGADWLAADRSLNSTQAFPVR